MFTFITLLNKQGKKGGLTAIRHTYNEKFYLKHLP